MKSRSEVLFTKKELEKRFSELANQISNDYKNKKIHLITILNGGVYFFAYLSMQLKNRVTVDFIKASSYGNDTKSSGNVKLLKDIDVDIKGEDVILIDDICDSGRTLKVIKEYLLSKEPNSVKTCVMLDKKERREVAFEVDYFGFEIPNFYVYGYGLDYNNFESRNLPDIYKVIFEEE